MVHLLAKMKGQKLLYIKNDLEKVYDRLSIIDVKDVLTIEGKCLLLHL